MGAACLRMPTLIHSSTSIALWTVAGGLCSNLNAQPARTKTQQMAAPPASPPARSPSRSHRSEVSSVVSSGSFAPKFRRSPRVAYSPSSLTWRCRRQLKLCQLAFRMLLAMRGAGCGAQQMPGLRSTIDPAASGHVRPGRAVNGEALRLVAVQYRRQRKEAANLTQQPSAMGCGPSSLNGMTGSSSGLQAYEGLLLVRACSQSAIQGVRFLVARHCPEFVFCTEDAVHHHQSCEACSVARADVAGSPDS